MEIYKKLLSIKQAGIKLQRDTDGYGYKYANLSQIQEKLGDVLQEQGLIIVHSITDNKVRTEIIDTEKEGGKVMSEIEMNTTKAQDKGSEITYYRRYNLLSLLDLEVDDDDGKKAQDSKPFTKKVELPFIKQENIDNLEALIKKGTAITLDKVKEKYQLKETDIQKLNDLNIT